MLAAWLLAVSIAAPCANEAGSAALVAEVRRTFTVMDKTIPPEIFRDFGDGNLADSAAIWVAVDVKAAIGSNLYFDPIERNGEWVTQRKAQNTADELTSYTYIGATENGLLVVLAAYSGGGSGDFFTLHILDLAVALAFDSIGKVYERIALTNLRSVAMGDRWDGRVTLARNTITIVTTRDGPTDNSGKRRTEVIEAQRP